MVFRSVTLMAMLAAAASASVVVRQTQPGEKCAGADGQPFIPFVGCTDGFVCTGAAPDWGKICVQIGSAQDGTADSSSSPGGTPTTGNGTVAATPAASSGGDGESGGGDSAGTQAPSDGDSAATQAPSGGDAAGTQAPSGGDGAGTQAPSGDSGSGDGGSGDEGGDAAGGEGGDAAGGEGGNAAGGEGGDAGGGEGGDAGGDGVSVGAGAADDADDAAAATSAPDDAEDSTASVSDEPIASVTPEIDATPIARADDTPEPTDDDDGSVCFPADATVELQDGSVVPMAEVSIGDMVKVGVNQFSKVFMFTHKMSDVTHKFVTLQTASGASLALTKGHYIYADGALVAAAEVKVGSTVTLGNGAVDTVVAVGSKVSAGLYNPQTVNGDVVVNGIVSSTYTTSVEPSFAHAILAPFRFMNSLGFHFTALESGSQRLADVAPNGALVL